MRTISRYFLGFLFVLAALLPGMATAEGGTGSKVADKELDVL